MLLALIMAPRIPLGAAVVPGQTHPGVRGVPGRQVLLQERRSLVPAVEVAGKMPLLQQGVQVEAARAVAFHQLLPLRLALLILEAEEEVLSLLVQWAVPAVPESLSFDT